MGNKEGKRTRGIVINFLTRKGYGFIQSEEGEKVFVHYSDIRGRSYRTLVEGEDVEYIVAQGPKGVHAVDVLRLNPPAEEELPPIIDDKKTW